MLDSLGAWKQKTYRYTEGFFFLQAEWRPWIPRWVAVLTWMVSNSPEFGLWVPQWLGDLFLSLLVFVTAPLQAACWLLPL